VEKELHKRSSFFLFSDIMFSELEPIVRLRTLFERLNSDAIWFYAVDQSVKDMIIQMNTEDQLEEDGIDSLGRELGDYSPYTVEIKKMKGQRYDHITLKDTGAFYDSWVVTVDRDGIDVDADDTSLYDRPLFKVWGEDVLGLTKENLAILQSVIAERYIEFIMNELLH
jgi:hypothetical protein